MTTHPFTSTLPCKISKFILLTLLTGLFFLTTSANTQASIKYVRQNGDDANDGDSWATAYATIQKAIDNTMAGDEIWVAAGVYKPTKDITGNPNPPFATQKTFGFNGTWRKLYGGFPPNGNPGFQNRNWEVHLTILSGDIDNNDMNSDGNFISESYLHNVGLNVNNVIVCQNTGTDMVLDGFIVTAGNAGQGAGMSNNALTGGTSSPTISNCKFMGNHGSTFARGGGFANTVGTNAVGSPVVTNCVFSGNRAGCCGGGIFTGSQGLGGVCNALFQDCLITGNVTPGLGGGANNDISFSTFSGTVSTTYLNCTFSFNTAFQGGGLAFIANGTGLVNGSAINCKFIANSTTYNPASTSQNNGVGGGVLNGVIGNTATVATQWVNCLFLGNKAHASGHGGGAVRNSRNLSTATGTMTPVFTNCTFAGNNGPGGALSDHFGSMATYNNCITWANNGGMTTHSSANVSINNSILQGGCPPANAVCTSVLNTNPFFVMAPNPSSAPSSSGDVHLQNCSPAVDLALSPGAPANDLEGAPTFDGDGNGSTIRDMGALERQFVTETTYNGNVTFNTQAQVDAWLPCYTHINGNLTIQTASINNLAALGNLQHVTGTVHIKFTGLTNLNGLQSLNYAATFKVTQNSSLTSLDGLEGLSSVPGTLLIAFNYNLSDCCAIHNLINTPGAVGFIQISRNATGCDNIYQINTSCSSPNIIVPPGGGKVEMAADPQELSPVMVYPNPASGEATVQIELDFSTGSVKIFDIRGQLMLQRELDANTTLHPLPLDGLPAGIYTIHVMLDGESYTQKLVIE